VTLAEALTTRYGPLTESGLPIEVKGASRLHLPAIFADMGYTIGAEIGTWKGEFAEALCQGIPNLTLTCVDPWKAYPDYHDHRIDRHISEAKATAFRRLAPYPCVFLVEYSVEAASHVDDDSLDFVYIDANHTFEYVVADLAAWIPKVRSGGVIAGHDYKSLGNRPDMTVVEAIQGWTRAHRVAPWYVLGRHKTRPGEVRDKHRSWLWEKP